MTYHQEVDELIDALRPRVDYAAIEIAYWITTSDGEVVSDGGAEWCFDCVRAELRRLNKSTSPAEEYHLGGGWVSQLDILPRCVHCGVRLQADLTIRGALYMLERYQEHPPAPDSISDIYAALKMLQALRYTRPQLDPLAREAIAIGRSLVAAIAAREQERAMP